jgi:hypothetical protein
VLMHGPGQGEGARETGRGSWFLCNGRQLRAICKKHAGIRKGNNAIAHVKQLLPRNRHFPARGIVVEIQTNNCTRQATNGLHPRGTHPVILLDVADDAVAEPAHFLQGLVPLLGKVRHPQQATREPWCGKKKRGGGVVGGVNVGGGGLMDKRGRRTGGGC